MRRYRELTGNGIYDRQAADTSPGKLKKLLLYPQPTDGKLVLYYHGEYPALSADS